MRIITEQLSGIPSDYDNFHYINNDSFLIFDIETTGFSRKYATIYMVGFIYKENSKYIYSSIFAEKPEDESKVIKYFINFIKDFDHIISFNGDSFDFPFVKERAEKHNIPFDINEYSSIDIYSLIRSYRESLDFKDLKLNTLQSNLGYKRKDTHTGGSLINIYKKYVENKSADYYDLLVLHNKEDVEGMIYLLPLMDLFLYLEDYKEERSIEHISISNDITYQTITYKSTYIIAIDFIIRYKGSVLVFEKDTCYFQLLLPIENTSKKLFFENYKDYYLSLETNEIMHKSLGQFIPVNERTNVNKSDCYIESRDSFIPIYFNTDKYPVFQDYFNAKKLYVSLKAELGSEFYKKQLAGFLKYSSR